ncbi:MAG: four-helix bundle copper-binding protein [Bacillota bacterium]
MKCAELCETRDIEIAQECAEACRRCAEACRQAS